MCGGDFFFPPRIRSIQVQVNGGSRKGENQPRDIDLHRGTMVGQDVGSTEL